MSSGRSRELVGAAVDAVLADFARTGARGEVAAAWVHGARLGAYGPEKSAPEMLVEVADDFREYHSQEVYCWPECRVHDAGLWALVDDGVAVWWCKRGDHHVAAIGHLGE